MSGRPSAAVIGERWVVERVGLEGGQDEIVRELLAKVEHVRPEGPDCRSTPAHASEREIASSSQRPPSGDRDENVGLVVHACLSHEWAREV